MARDPAGIAIEVLGDDAGATAIDEWLAVRNGLDVRPMSAQTFRLRRAAEVAALRLGVRSNGQLVGIGASSWDVVRRGSGDATIHVWVPPEHRRRGIGSTLWPRLAEFAREGGMRGVVSRVMADDPESLGFARHRGLNVAGMQQLGILHLSASHAAAASPVVPGIAICAIGDRPELYRAIYEHLVSVLPEVPSWGDAALPSFEAWQAMIAEPAYRADLSLIALDGDNVVGQIDVDDDGDQRAFIGMLTVAPRARRRGIARALKQELARRAAADGLTSLLTVNDGTNEAIRTLNEALGYRYLPEALLLHGPLPAA